MKFKIPFTLGSLDAVKNKAIPFKRFIHAKKTSSLQHDLTSADISITEHEYRAVCLRTSLITLVLIVILSTTGLYFAKVSSWYFIAPVFTILVAGFVAMSQRLYPKVYANRKQKNIDKNLIPALEDMLVQLNSGIPLFTIMVNLSSSGYGELSEEFKRAVRKINAGLSHTVALEELGEKNNSLFFRRTLWQMSNGLKAGGDLSAIISESIKSLYEEQYLQIQNYGNKLNPLIMFYMLTSVILPALSATFLTILASMISLDQKNTMGLFIGLFVIVGIIQFMFLGVIKSTRPSLLG